MIESPLFSSTMAKTPNNFCAVNLIKKGECPGRPCPGPDKMPRIDLHVHTTASSCSIFQPRALAALAVSMNLPAVVITNHHDCRGDTAQLGKVLERAGILLFPGLEITNRWGDFLLLGESLEELQPRRRDFPAGLLPRPDVAVIWAHPYRLMSPAEVESIAPRVMPFIDAVEGINGNCLIENGEANRMAMEMGRRMGKPLTGGSDAHSDRMFFSAWTDFERPVRGWRDLVGQLKEGRVSPGCCQAR